MAKKINRSKSNSQERQRLGAGLSSILRQAAEIDSDSRTTAIKTLANTVMMVPVGKIRANKFQPRQHFQPEPLEELAASIRHFGLIQPITVRYHREEDTFEIISGERRWRASKMAKLKEIPAYIRIADDQELMEMALIENLQREDLNAIEIATTYSRLKKEFELTDERIADRVGKKRSTITNFIRLLKLPEKVQDAIRENSISMGHARALVGLPDPHVQLHILDQILKKKLSVRATEKLIQELQAGTSTPTKAAARELPTQYEAVQRQLRTYFGSKKVELQLKGQDKGQIVIPFSSAEELNNFLERIEE